MNLSELIAQAFSEDVPHGDLTTDGLQLQSPRSATPAWSPKKISCFPGREIFEQCVHYMSPEAQLRWQFENGAFILNQQTVCWIKSDLLLLLKAERVALNFMGHLSGIATLTRCFVHETRDSECKILDTRKTTPLLRALGKAGGRSTAEG